MRLMSKTASTASAEQTFNNPLEHAFKEPAWGLAKTISILFSPPLLGSIGLSLLAEKIGGERIWLWAALYGVGCIVLPILYVISLMRSGEVSDFHISNRLERIKPLEVALFLFSLTTLIFVAAGAPYVFQVFALVGAVQTAMMLLITTRWKISGHSAGAAGFSVLLWALFGPAAAPAFLIIPIVLWGRVYLDRHDFLQTLAGCLAGVGFMFIALALLAQHCPDAGLACI